MSPWYNFPMRVAVGPQVPVLFSLLSRFSSFGVCAIQMAKIVFPYLPLPPFFFRFSALWIVLRVESSLFSPAKRFFPRAFPPPLPSRTRDFAARAIRPKLLTTLRGFEGISFFPYLDYFLFSSTTSSFISGCCGNCNQFWRGGKTFALLTPDSPSSEALSTFLFSRY